MPGQENEITIVVRARSSVRQGFDAARKEAELAGKDAGEDYTRKFGDTVGMRMMQHVKGPLAKVGQEMGQVLGEHAAKGVAQVIAKGIATVPDVAKDDAQKAGQGVGQEMGESAGRTIGERIREHLRRVQSQIRSVVNRSGSGGLPERDERGRFLPRGGGDSDNDVDKNTLQRLLARMLNFGKEAAGAFSRGFAAVASTFFSGDFISLIVKIFAGTALIGALAPALGAAITTAVLLGLGGGVIGAGIAAAFKDPQIAAAGKELGERLNRLFVEFGKPFRGPVAEFMEKFLGFVERLSPKMQQLAEHMAPVTGKLGQGLIEMLDKMMPGILKAVEASKPLFETLAKHMPEIGEALNKFFTLIAENGEGANEFFDDMLNLIEKLIVVLGVVIATLTTIYTHVSFVINFAIDLFASWKTGVELAVEAVKRAFSSMRRWVVDQLEKILNGAAAALSWVPGVGPKLEGARQKFAAFRRGANEELGKVKDKTVNFTIETFGLAALRSAAQLAREVAAAGYAHGGITGAANGGMRSGLTMVGERGRELVSLAPGSRVHSNEDTERMMARGGGGPLEVVLSWATGTQGALADALAEHIRIDVQRKGYGSVQAAYGQGR